MIENSKLLNRIEKTLEKLRGLLAESDFSGSPKPNIKTFKSQIKLLKYEASILEEQLVSLCDETDV